MSEAILTFQSQLSGIMESVLRAAVHEITSLVEGSFQGEVVRSRQEVESLKQRLQLSERKWREREQERSSRAKCVECGRTAESSAEMKGRISRSQSGAEEETAVKEEEELGKKQSSCLWETLASGPTAISGRSATTRSSTSAETSREMPTDAELNESLLMHIEDLQVAEDSGVVHWGFKVHSEGTDKCKDSTDVEGKQSIISEGAKEQVVSNMVKHNMEKICRLQAVIKPGSECSSNNQEELNSKCIMYKKVTVLTNGNSDTETDEPNFSTADTATGPSSEMINMQDKLHRVPQESKELRINDVISLSHTQNTHPNHTRNRSTKRTQNLSLQPRLPLQRSTGKPIQGATWETTTQANTHIPSESIFNQINLTAAKHFTVCQDTSLRDSQHVCIYCGKNFSYISRLKIHILKHTGEKPFSCTQCGKRFTVARNLERHQKIHWGDAAFCCTQCGKRFRRADHLKVHQRVHTGERPYCCPQCNKCFRFSGDLNTHKRVHTGEKPYRCSLCTSQFSQLRQLKSHMRSHKGLG